jgi:uncharacterized YccA/Bax inhibitor family protein
MCIKQAARARPYRAVMPFMFLILAFLLGAVVWGFFHSNPRGVSRVALHACNVAILVLGIVAAAASGLVLHTDALARRPEEGAVAIYLAIMASGTAFMIVVALGGLARNLFFFPLSRRKPEPQLSR